MKSVPKLIRRFAGILAISSLLILLLNIAAVYFIGRSQTANISPYSTAERMARALKRTANGYILEREYLEELVRAGAWAVFIDNESRRVLWHTDDLPEEIPMEYSLADISSLTRGYVADYPTYAGEAEGGLLVIGYPKTRYWKSMWPSWDYDFIAKLPRNFFLVAAANITLVFLIYAAVNYGLLRSLKPIVSGIQALPAGEAVYIREKGPLAEVAAHINRTSEILQDQKVQLRKKEKARANWIAGVSHDIRTPLSMVMGYAQQLQSDTALSDDGRRKAEVILRQSLRMRALVSDLNLASKLEYNMQPLSLKRENAVALVRQAAADFVNSDIDGKYPIRWMTDGGSSVCLIQGDRGLLERAVSNLIQNSINHNEDSCTVYVSVRTEDSNCVICVEDDGVGASDEQIKTLNSAPHYMVCDTDTAGQRHGLGLLIVKQIAASHGGRVIIEHSEYGGLAVKIRLPMEKQS